MEGEDAPCQKYLGVSHKSNTEFCDPKSGSYEVEYQLSEFPNTSPPREVDVRDGDKDSTLGNFKSVREASQ